MILISLLFKSNHKLVFDLFLVGFSSKLAFALANVSSSKDSVLSSLSKSNDMLTSELDGFIEDDGTVRNEFVALLLSKRAFAVQLDADICIVATGSIRDVLHSILGALSVWLAEAASSIDGSLMCRVCVKSSFAISFKDDDASPVCHSSYGIVASVELVLNEPSSLF